MSHIDNLDIKSIICIYLYLIQQELNLITFPPLRMIEKLETVLLIKENSFHRFWLAIFTQFTLLYRLMFTFFVFISLWKPGIQIMGHQRLTLIIRCSSIAYNYSHIFFQTDPIIMMFNFFILISPYVIAD